MIEVKDNIEYEEVDEVFVAFPDYRDAKGDVQKHTNQILKSLRENPVYQIGFRVNSALVSSVPEGDYYTITVCFTYKREKVKEDNNG